MFASVQSSIGFVASLAFAIPFVAFLIDIGLRVGIAPDFFAQPSQLGEAPAFRFTPLIQPEVLRPQGRDVLFAAGVTRMLALPRVSSPVISTQPFSTA